MRVFPFAMIRILLALAASALPLEFVIAQNLVGTPKLSPVDDARIVAHNVTASSWIASRTGTMALQQNGNRSAFDFRLQGTAQPDSESIVIQRVLAKHLATDPHGAQLQVTGSRFTPTYYDPRGPGWGARRTDRDADSIAADLRLAVAREDTAIVPCSSARSFPRICGPVGGTHIVAMSSSRITGDSAVVTLTLFSGDPRWVTSRSPDKLTGFSTYLIVRRNRVWRFEKLISSGIG